MWVKNAHTAYIYITHIKLYECLYILIPSAGGGGGGGGGVVGVMNLIIFYCTHKLLLMHNRSLT